MRDRHRDRRSHGSAVDSGSERDAVGDVRLRLALQRRKAQREAERKQREASAGADATRAEKGALGAPQVTFSAAEAEEDAATAGSIFAEDDIGAAAPGDERIANPGFDEALFGDPEGLEHASFDQEGADLKGSGGMVRNVGKLSKVTGGPALPKALVLASNAPEIVHELQQGHYLKVFKKLVTLAPPKLVGAAIIEVASKLGIGTLAKKAVEALVRFGTEANVLIALGKWTLEGFEQIREAHDRGDQETRIDLYADAFAHAFVYGEGDAGQAALRAATDEERQAVELGRAAGARSAGATGELAPLIGQALLEQHGSPEAVIRHIKSYVLKQAGLGGQAKARTGA